MSEQCPILGLASKACEMAHRLDREHDPGTAKSQILRNDPRPAGNTTWLTRARTEARGRCRASWTNPLGTNGMLVDLRDIAALQPLKAGEADAAIKALIRYRSSPDTTRGIGSFSQGGRCHALE